MALRANLSHAAPGDPSGAYDFRTPTGPTLTTTTQRLISTAGFAFVLLVQRFNPPPDEQRLADLIFDIGTHHGFKIDIFLRLGASVVAVESGELNKRIQSGLSTPTEASSIGSASIHALLID